MRGREQVVAFAERMLRKLAKREHHGSWDDYTIHHVLMCIKGELREANDAYYKHMIAGGNQFQDEITREAFIDELVDIANYCMIGADILGKK